MRFLATFFEVLGFLWLFVAGGVIVLGTVNVGMRNGLSAGEALMGPFNIEGWFLIFLILVPGIQLFSLADKLRQKIKPKRPF
jgi:uncharacterized membrane protein YbjE (DUF340 family)